MSTNCEITINNLSNIVIALSAVATAIAAWRALSTWKNKSKYKIAQQCMQEAQKFNIDLLIDRFNLSHTAIQAFDEYLPKSKASGDIFFLTALDLQTQFGEKEVSLIFKKISDLAQEFSICTGIYPYYKTNQPLGSTRSNQLVPNDKLNKFVPRAIEMFESNNPMDDNDTYKKKVDDTFDALKKFLSKHLEIS